MDNGQTSEVPRRVAVILSTILLIWVDTPAVSQTLQPQDFNTLNIYELMLQANREPPRAIDSTALQLSRKLVDGQHTLVVIDQELLVVGHALGSFVTSRNRGKDREERLFTEQEIIPTLFRNFEVFRDLFAISIADTFSADDLKSMAVQGDLDNQKLDTDKSNTSAAKFHNAAMVFGGSLLAKMSADPDNRLKLYGLR